MGVSNLGMIFGPTLIKGTLANLDALDNIAVQSRIMTFILRHFTKLI